MEFETKLTGVIQRTHNVKSFRFSVAEDFSFKAGQFFFLTIRNKDKEISKHFSFSNAPTEKNYMEFTKRLTDSEFSQALDELKPGDWARVRMAYGDFVLRAEDKKIAFLCGGIGVTPIRSICKAVVDSKLERDIRILYGNRTEADIAFREDFDAMQKDYPGLKVTHVISQADEGWKGRRGHIDSELIKAEMPDYKERRFYACGPPGMVTAMQNILENELSLAKEQIITEKFSGY
ncbi:MAG: FAD-dependent oxidoreductase [bacterium]